VLDVGAFRGTGTQFLRDLGLEATGYEIDSHEAEKSEFVTSEFPTPETEYDMLWFSHVLEHVPSAIDMLKQWREFAPSAFVEIPPGNYQLPHILVFDQTSFRKTVEQSGWSIQIMDGTIYAILRRT
jgi:hypothetical protein